MKRRVITVLLCIVLLAGVFVLPASAESTASRVESFITVNAEGDCLVALTVTFHLETPDETLTFPLPGNASGITMNGATARTTRNGDVLEVDVGRSTGGMIGDFTVLFSYTIPKAVAAQFNENGSSYLQLTLPLLSGFSYPVEYLSFVVTLPGDIKYYPALTSTYRQAGIESVLPYEVDKNMISGKNTSTLNDHEAVTMTMVVPQEMFPSISTYRRVGNPEVVPMLIFAGLALLYWLLFLRTWPLIRRRSVTIPEGVSAGEVGCHLTLAGGDLTMMVMNWAQLGYIMIQMDGGKVTLFKRMDMGNERSPFEVKVYNMLFAGRSSIDATGNLYTKISRKVFSMIPGERNLCHPKSGNMKLFRGLCCVSQVFCGICVAMNMTTVVFLQVVLCIILSVVGAVSAWQIHEIAYRTHLRGKTRVYIGLVCLLIWIVLGILCGEWIIPTCAALGQFLMGYLAAYGGRRSDVGRHDAGQILGLRQYLKHISKEDINRLMKTDPDYFFNMAPYALSLGVIHSFAKNFGSRKLDQCPYLVSRIQGKHPAEDWAEILADTADMMDAKYRKGEIEKWTRIPLLLFKR